MKRAVPIAGLALIAALELAAAASAAEPRASLPDIEDEVMCPICGTTLELSEAPQAERERALIRELIDQGRSKEEIKDALIAEYGEEVLAAPDDDGFDLAAWLVPALAIAAAATALIVGMRRRGPRDEDRPTEEELDPADARKLDADLSRWE